MARIKKEITQELIYYIKKIEIRANYFAKDASSAWEFGRQMESPKLKRINPKFQIDFFRLSNYDSNPANMKVEFINGSIWETPTTLMRLEELRYELFSRAEEIEDEMERSGQEIVKPGDESAGGGVGKKGEKGGKKK